MPHLKLAWVFVIMMVVVSAAMNFSFGWRLGEHSHTVTEHVHDGWIFGLLSLAGDGLKIAMGVLTVVCLTAKRMPIGLRVSGSVFCGFLFACATLYSLNSAIGSISLNRTDMAGVREAKATNYDAVKIQLDRVQKEQSWLDQGYRASAAVAADLAGLRQSSLWTRTAGCTNATVDESRSFCQRLSALQAELGTSKRAEDLNAKAEALSKQLAGMGGAVVADPHAKMLNQLTGYDQPTIVLAWLLLVVALVEGGSTLGPIALSMAYRALQVREEARTAAKAFAPISVASAAVQPVLAPRSPMVALEKMTGVSAVGTKSVDLAPKQPSVTNSGTDPDGPGTPIAKPEAPKEEVADTNVAQFPLKPRQETNAQYRIVPRIDGPKKRGERPATKEFFRQCLGIDKDAKAAILSAIRDKKPIEKHVAGRLMDASDVYGIYLEWWGEDGGAMSPKALSNHLGDYLNIPKGTRKLKGVTGLRNKKGMKFPVYDARVAEPLRRTA